MDLGLLNVEISSSHSDTPHSLALAWSSDLPISENSILTTHNTHNKQTSMPQVVFEPAVPQLAAAVDLAPAKIIIVLYECTRIVFLPAYSIRFLVGSL